MLYIMLMPSRQAEIAAAGIAAAEMAAAEMAAAEMAAAEMVALAVVIMAQIIVMEEEVEAGKLAMPQIIKIPNRHSQSRIKTG